MNENLTEKSCMDFCAALASSAPVPGGGGATALAGALAAALCAMAARLTASKPAFADRAGELNGLIARADALRGALLRLIDADAEGFAPLSKAYAIPKDEPGRAEPLRRATLAACKAPAEMMEALADCTALLETLLQHCSRLMLSDVGCAAALCAGALEAAAMNVFVNTKSLKGDPEAEAVALRASRLLDDCLPGARAVSSQVLSLLREEGENG